MYYHTPNLNRYTDKIIHYRVAIILSFIMMALLTLLFYRPSILSSELMFWLKESPEYQRTQSKELTTLFSSKLVVEVDSFTPQMQKELENLQLQLQKLPEVQRVSSLFSSTIIKTQKNEDASIVGVVNIQTLSTIEIKALVSSINNPYENFVSDDYKTFTYYILSHKIPDISSVNTSLSYKYSALNTQIDTSEYILFIVISILFAILLFYILFSNFISSLGALLVITLSTTFTLSSIYFFTGIKELHIAMPFISISIGLVDYLFFYYRWHVSQYKADTKSALLKMLNRNRTPALWTSLLSILALGSLLFIDSDIIKLLSLSIILSSLITYIINLTFLPALLSFFQLKHAHVSLAKVCYLFASSELHYNKKLLYSFIAFTLILLGVGAKQIYNKNNNFFNFHVQNEELIINVPYNNIDINYIASLHKFSDDLMDEFPDEIDHIDSLASLIEELNNANVQTSQLNKQALLQALFYMDLYNLKDKYIDAQTSNIVITIFDIDKNELLQWLKAYKGINIYFVDKGALLDSAMYDKALLLSLSLFSALLIIALVMGWIFRTISMVVVGFIVTAIPIVWFGLTVKLLDIALSLDMLIAMSISVGLASDATIHFAFKYFRSRHFGRSQKHALEKMYFYAGIPVIFGSFILIAIFTTLAFSGIVSLQYISLYSALLIFISLLTDLFILPVILLYLDSFSDGYTVSSI